MCDSLASTPVMQLAVCLMARVGGPGQLSHQSVIPDRLVLLQMGYLMVCIILRCYFCKYANLKNIFLHLLQWRAPNGLCRVDDTSPENTIVGLPPG